MSLSYFLFFFFSYPFPFSFAVVHRQNYCISHAQLIDLQKLKVFSSIPLPAWHKAANGYLRYSCILRLLLRKLKRDLLVLEFLFWISALH